MHQSKYFVQVFSLVHFFDNSNFYYVSVNIFSWIKFDEFFNSSIVTVTTDIIVLESIFDINH